MKEQVALIEMIDRFLGGDHSRDLVKRIEEACVQSFRDTEWYDEVELALALYAPGERRPEYVDAVQLERILRSLREQLR